MDTLDLLQEVLDDYGGTILIVSHDRDFLDRVVSSVIYLKGDGTVYEHAGSYSELLEKLPGHEIKPVSKVNAKKTTPQSTTSAKPKKLSYNQQRLLEVLPAEISAIEQEISQVEQELSNADLYTSDPKRFDELSRKLPELQNVKDGKENQWLELQMLAEELEK